MKYLYRRTLLLLLLVCIGTVTFAQKNTKPIFKGRVLDENANPLSGVYVTVEGLEAGDVSDPNGSFEILEEIKTETKLSFTCLGYKSLTIPVRKIENFIVRMESDIPSSERQIDILYRARPNYSVGSAAYTMYSQEWRSGLSEGMSAELIGRMPGLINGTMIRGGATTGDRSVLYLVDGMVMNHIESLNEDDIESVTVLKDAAAAAIYGLRGGNGIISLKTKRGFYGKPQINVKISNTINAPTVKPYMISSGQYAKLMNEASVNDGGELAYSQEEVNAYASGEYPYYFPNNNWYDKLVKSLTSTQNIYASASGGRKLARYYTSLGYTYSDSNFKTDGTNDKTYGQHLFNVRSNVDLRISSRISAYQNVFARIVRLVNPNASGIYSSVFALAPTVYGPTTDDGGVIVTTQNTSPAYAKINRSGYASTTGCDLTSITGVNIDLGFLLNGLSTKGIVRFYSWSASTVTGQRDYTRYVRDESQTSDLVFNTYGTSRDEPLTLSKTIDGHHRTEYEWNLNFERNWGIHNVYATALFNRQDYTTSDIRPYITMTYGFQTGYGYKNFLFADFISSYQGSERFAENHRYGFFPSVDVAWVPTNHLLKDQDILTYLKFKASYGLVGNDRTSGRFLYEDNISGGGSQYVSYYGSSFNEVQIGNSDITWEKSRKANLGFEATLFNQFSVNFDYFQENRKDILLQDGVRPLASGIPSSAAPFVNAGKMRNQGFELVLNYQKTFSKDFSLNASANMLYNKNKIIYLQEVELAPDYVYTKRSTGYSIGQLWGYEIDKSNGNGYFNTQEELDNSRLTYDGASPRLGDFIYKDFNNDKVIDEKDLVPMGKSTIPPFSWGASVNLKWKNFTLSVLFQGISGTSTFRSGLGYYENVNNGTFFTHHLNAWTKERFANGEKITAPALSLNTSASMKNNSFFHEKTDYVRLKNLKLGYTLPNSLTNKMGMKQIEIYFSGRNLLTLDRLKFKDIDVEMSNVSSTPVYRNFSLGLDVRF